MQVTTIDIIVLQVILWIGRLIVIFLGLWGLVYIADKAISRWLHFIGAWSAVIEALKKRAPKRTARE